MNTTPEEKAKELIKKFQVYLPLMLHKEKTNPQVKEYAIICVSETISQLKNIEKSLLTMKVNLDPIIKFNEQVLEKIKSL